MSTTSPKSASAGNSRKGDLETSTDLDLNIDVALVDQHESLENSGEHLAVEET